MNDTIHYTFDRRTQHEYEPEVPGLTSKELAEDIVKQQYMGGWICDEEFPITIHVSTDEDEPWTEFKVELICQPEFYARKV